MRMIKAILALILLALAVSATAQTAIPNTTSGTATQMTTVLGGWGSKLLMKIPIKDTTTLWSNVSDSGRITIQPSTGILYWHNGNSWRTISAGTTYLAGYGLSLTGVTFRADTTVLVSKAYLTAALTAYIKWSDTVNKIATKADLSGYQPSGNYLLKSDSALYATQYDISNNLNKSDTITLVATKSDLTNYQPTGDYLLAGDSNIFTSVYQNGLKLTTTDSGKYRGGKIYYIPNYVQVGDTAHDQAIYRALFAARANNYDADVVDGAGYFEIKDSVLVFGNAAYDSTYTYNPYCIICIPLSIQNGAKTGRVTIRGLNPLRYTTNADSTVFHFDSSSTVWWTKRTGQSTVPDGGAYIIGNSGNNQQQKSQNSTATVIKDMAFITPSGSNMGVISASNSMSTYLYNCVAIRDTVLSRTTKAPGKNGVAFNFTQYNFPNVDNRIENCVAVGYYNGIRGGEGFSLYNCKSIGCTNGYSSHRSRSTQYINNLTIKNCEYAISAIEVGDHLVDSCRFVINNLNILINDDSTKWYNFKYAVYDFYNNSIGIIKSYNINYNNGTGSRNDLFTKYNATRVVAYPFSQGWEAPITAGTTAQFWRGDKTFQTLNVAAVTGLQTALDGKASTTTTVTANAPLTGSTTLASNISLGITQATTSTNGYLSSTDWNTFNNKLSSSRLINTTSPLAGGGDLSADRTLSIADAVADSATKGAATFTTADFNSSGGIISLDYSHMQQTAITTTNLGLKLDANLLNNTGTKLPFPGTTDTINTSNSGTLALQEGVTFSATGAALVRIGTNVTFTSTAGAPRGLAVSSTFAPTSGTANFAQLGLVFTVNQTGGANGITRGIFINPTLTAASDFRCIEIGNGTGHAIYSSGAAPSYHLGELHLGSSTDAGAYILQVTGAMYLTSAPTSAGSYVALTRNTSTSAVESVTLSTVATTGLQSDETGVDVTSSAATLSITAITGTAYYSFTGTTSTWTLPSLASGVHGTYVIKNMGSGNITLNSNAGGNDIYEASAINTFVIAPGFSYTVHNNGTKYTLN